MTMIAPATSVADLEEVRGLMRAYGAYLASNPTGAANICIQGFEQEILALPAPYNLILLAKVDGQPAGCVALKPIPGGIEMKRLYVDPTYRGLKLGKQLIEQSIAWARTQGYEAMYLDTVPAAMPEANALYERLGFLEVERYNQNPVPNIVFYRLPL
jgi:GNAT superfamily N-acetyltransferase